MNHYEDKMILGNLSLGRITYDESLESSMLEYLQKAYQAKKRVLRYGSATSIGELMQLEGWNVEPIL
jgi:hypothetical protein